MSDTTGGAQSDETADTSAAGIDPGTAGGGAIGGRGTGNSATDDIPMSEGTDASSPTSGENTSPDSTRDVDEQPLPDTDQVIGDAMAHQTVTNDAVAGEPVIPEPDNAQERPEDDPDYDPDLAEDPTPNESQGISPGVGSKGSANDDPAAFSNEYGEVQPIYDEQGDEEIEIPVDAADSRPAGDEPPLGEEVDPTRNP